MGKSSRIAACLEDDSVSWKVSWRRAAIDVSGVAGDDRGALDVGRHLLSMTLFALFSGFGSRNTDLAVSLSLLRGTRFSSRTRETRRRGGD